MPTGPRPKSPAKPRVVAIDTETTGVDLYHSARPFFVTVAVEGDPAPLYWEWDVDPLTRMPVVPPGDLAEVMGYLDAADVIVGQNIKFDVGMLTALVPGLVWPWHKTFDTLIASHLLASNKPHDLTSLALQYLGVNIKPEEDKLAATCNEARRFARSHYPDWKIAKQGLDGMPSARETVHKFDMWLPRALAVAGAPVPEHYAHVLADYSTADSAVTLGLYPVFRREIDRRGYAKVFAESMRLPGVIKGMENRGVSISRTRTHAVRREMTEEAIHLGRVMVSIAESRGHELALPKAGRNKSLMDFATSARGLNLKLDKDDPEWDSKSIWVPHERRTDTGNLSLSAKDHIPYYIELLRDTEPNGKRIKFLTALRDKSKRDTACTYMEGYERFWLVSPVGGAGGEWFVLHPSFNQTGTDTLRFSCTNPNAQNISKQEAKCQACEGKKGEVEHCAVCQGKGISFRSVRYCFGPAPGREWWSLDYKNLELRLPFYKSGEQALIDLFERPDDPPYFGSNHILNFHTVYPDLWDAAVAKVGPEKVAGFLKKEYKDSWYQWCKNGGFAIQYQAGDETADRAFHKRGARRLLKAKFARLDALNVACCKFADKYGYVETMPDRTVDPERGYPLLCTRTERGGIKPTIPLSYYIQGTAMWLTRRAMVRCQEQLDEWLAAEGFDGFMTMQVHDEIVFDFPKSEIPPKLDSEGKNPAQRGRSNLGKVRRLAALMAQGGDDVGVPTPAGIEYNENNWAEGVAFA